MNDAARPTSRRKPALALICLTFFVLVLPLTLSRSWLPTMRADEAAYYLGSLSLLHDQDFAYGDEDARRFFREYPGTDNLKLTVGKEEPKAHFGVPFVYPLLTVPAVALFGGKGMIAVNAMLLMAMVWMAYVYLRRYNDESVATLFAVGFFLLGTAFAYTFWVQAEVFNMACVMAAFFLVERVTSRNGAASRSRPLGRRHALSIAGSGALLAIACFGKPMLALLALPLVYLLATARSRRAVTTWIAAIILSLAALVGTTLLATNQVWPYFAPRTGVKLHNPVNHEQRVVGYRNPKQDSLVPTDRLRNETQKLKFSALPNLRSAIPEFLWGRHGGFLFYMPFAVLAIVIFLLHERRSVFGWLILGSALLTAVAFVTLIQGHWLGGGGFVGNRYFTSVYPTFLFLVRRIRPRWLIAIGYGAAALFLGPILLTPLGAQRGVALQAHAGNPPLARLPLEWSLVNTLLSDYWSLEHSGIAFHGRRTEIHPRGREIWITGAQRVEINLLSDRAQRGFTFDVRNLAPDNRIEICLQSECRALRFHQTPPEGETERVNFPALAGDWIPRAGRDSETFKYRMTVDTNWGEAPRWRGSGKEPFYLGAALRLLEPRQEPVIPAQMPANPTAE